MASEDVEPVAEGASSRDGRLMRRPLDLRRPARHRSRGDGGPSRSWPQGFAATAEDRAALLVLSSLASLTAHRLLDLSQDHPSAVRCLDAVRNGLGASEADRALALSLRPRSVEEPLNRIGARLVPVYDPEYPPQLLELPDPPAGLFVLGQPLVAWETGVAIVGARNCSPAGREVATGLGRALAEAGACVVSGGARGIDAAAHRGALAAGGPTAAVLGCGVDVAYPTHHRRLLGDVAEHGTLVSEYPPGTRAEPFRFPARNRIVAGLARAVVVVEGAPGSGSLITVDHALEAGRDVFAVPGAPSSELSWVPLALLRDGAGLIRGPTDLLADLGLTTASEEATAGPEGGRGLSDPERRVLAALGAPAPPDRLAASTGLSLPEVMAALVSLELRRMVLAAGGRYERRPGSSGP